MISELTIKLPYLYKNKRWKLVYKPELHGLSLQSFFREVEGTGPNIIVIKEFDKYIFGAFMPISWTTSSVFYGSGESFLYTFRNSQTIHCYYATMKDDCFVCSNHEGIIFGAGEGKFRKGAGLFINSTLEQGYSLDSQTYGNQILSCGINFQIVNIEVWALL